MLAKVNPAGIRRSNWQEYAIRFLFGGVITAATGIIANRFGPAIGGLFLAFPAIFPASATLLEKHEKQKREKRGFHGTRRAREATSVDAAGAAIGSIGLFVFALMVLFLLPAHSHWAVLLFATVCWLALSILLWFLRKRRNLAKHALTRKIEPEKQIDRCCGKLRCPLGSRIRRVGDLRQHRIRMLLFIQGLL